VFVEPALIPIEGVLPARVLKQVETDIPEPSKVTSMSGCVESGAAVNCAYVIVANFSEEPLMIPKSMVSGVDEPVLETMVNLVNSREQTVAKLPTVPRLKKGNEALYRKLLHGKMDHLSQEQRETVSSEERFYEIYKILVYMRVWTIVTKKRFMYACTTPYYYPLCMYCVLNL